MHTLLIRLSAQVRSVEFTHEPVQVQEPGLPQPLKCTPIEFIDSCAQLFKTNKIINIILVLDVDTKELVDS